MKITKTQLRKIIQEELNEATVTDSATEDWTKRRPDESGRDFMRRMSYEKRMRAKNEKSSEELMEIIKELDETLRSIFQTTSDEDTAEEAQRAHHMLDDVLGR